MRQSKEGCIGWIQEVMSTFGGDTLRRPDRQHIDCDDEGDEDERDQGL